MRSRTSSMLLSPAMTSSAADGSASSSAWVANATAACTVVVMATISSTTASSWSLKYSRMPPTVPTVAHRPDAERMNEG
jgi:hypothetical protein